MSDVMYPSKKRIEIDGVLVHAEGDELLNFPEEAARQGYKLDDAQPRIAKERIEVDGVLVAAEGDVIPDGVDVPKKLTEAAPAPAEPAAEKPAGKKPPAAAKPSKPSK